MNDPFKNFKSLSSFSQAKKTSSKPTRTSDNFVEQVRGLGGSVANSFKNDVVKGTAQSIFDQLLGSAKSGTIPDQKAPDFHFEEMLKDRETSAKEEGRAEERALHQRNSHEEQVLFSMADEKLRKEIDGVRQELAALVKTMGQVQSQVENAIMDNVVGGGVYHLNYFQKLRSWIIFTRKSLEDASTWLAMSSGRGKRGYYWQQEAKSGTKYSMSSERTPQMSAG